MTGWDFSGFTKMNFFLTYVRRYASQKFWHKKCSLAVSEIFSATQNGLRQRSLYTMQLTDIAPLEIWRELEERINERSGMNASVFDVDGIRITDFVKWSNNLCPAIKATEKGQSYICSVAHQNLAAQAAKTRKPVIEICDAGMLKLVVPIFVNGKFLGVAGGCGCLERQEDIDPFMIHKTTGISEEKIARLSEGIPCMTRDEAASHAGYIENEIKRIIEAFENAA
jgi:ligand-binding sensor protein